MIEKKLVVGPFQCNCRILICEQTRDCILIDPGDDAETILSTLANLSATVGKVQVRGLFHTHAHLDHIGATREVKAGREKSGDEAKIYLHRADEPIYQNLKMQGQMFGFEYDDPTPVEKYFEDGQELNFGSLKFTILHTPGHSPGGVGIRLHESAADRISETVFTGDTLFAGSVGRTDLWGANQDQMFKSIRDRFLTLDGDTRVCAGHGADSTIGHEKRENPFLS